MKLNLFSDVAQLTRQLVDIESVSGNEAEIADAIEQATARWMDWTISLQTSKQYGIPRGLPYLTGFVIHCEVTDESFEAQAA